MRVNFSQPLRNLSSSYTASTRSSHYSIFGALVGTLTGLGLVVNKQKVRLFSNLLSVIIILLIEFYCNLCIVCLKICGVVEI